ncbi:TM2 domain-containing protein [Stenotrophomonas maltophilia]|uniref:TM2 domain-containing protein n=1 Tax=Stenotrophomonas maltophilia TaxID=40324 RepID=UPI002E7A50A1|nr:TM2 domain-containing protein [Stenotrophomonas maltophilia]
MALIQCKDCGKEISDKAAACIGCGAPTDSIALAPSPIAQPVPYLVKAAKSRGVYIVLGLFFGCLGIHNFYAGHHGRGLAQFFITAILGWFVIGLVITVIWVLVEIFAETRDGAGDLMV